MSKKFLVNLAFGSALAKLSQQVSNDGHLSPLFATQDNELQPVEIIQDAVDCFDIYFKCEVVEPALHSVRQIHICT